MIVEIHAINQNVSFTGKTTKCMGGSTLGAAKTRGGEPLLKLCCEETDIVSSGQRGGEGVVVERTATVFLHQDDLRRILEYVAESEVTFSDLKKDSAIKVAVRLLQDALSAESDA